MFIATSPKELRFQRSRMLLLHGHIALRRSAGRRRAAAINIWSLRDLSNVFEQLSITPLPGMEEHHAR